MTKSEIDDDKLLFKVWSGEPTPKEGYEKVSYYKLCTVKKVKKKWVYPALKRWAFNPHDSIGLLKAWLYWKQYFKNTQGESE